MAHKIKNRFATIATNDPATDPTPRVLLERTVREGKVIWVASERPDEVLVDGKNAKDADRKLKQVYAYKGWDLQFRGYGVHRLAI